MLPLKCAVLFRYPFGQSRPSQDSDTYAASDDFKVRPPTFLLGVPIGSRTRFAAVKGRCPISIVDDRDINLENRDGATRLHRFVESVENDLRVHMKRVIASTFPKWLARPKKFEQSVVQCASG